MVDETSPILNLDSHKLWIFYFIEPQHPYYLEERKNFDEFKETRDKEDLGCYMVSSREDSSLIDSDGRCAMLLGIKDKTAVVIMDQQGKLIAIKETQQMSWQQEDFLLAVEELVFN
ncbi:MAG: hypothetical protein PF447_08130 [Spirochaetaceae bacterium]|nr:hypothetical protein [Spirochaetaceae bacterium]